ncbi:hypothetical protein RHSIM_Rhsim08G0153500 [Rhododendron simsii]|uniref:Uncharacterized protein n=1 Tax=Rhododendron simsii TaxID=118357 RepID=A0A834LFM8_RHOSS|nr:hypothetical protein RHSIM_Rhsim08G0153500 [Rhododendron simsii]
MLGFVIQVLLWFCLFSFLEPNIHSSLQATKLDLNPTLKQAVLSSSSIGLKNGWHQIEGGESRRDTLSKVNALPDWPLMAVMDPYYDSEQYRKDGRDGTGHWVYEKQEDMEESARAELWREELIEEIEQKVEGLRELEEAGKKEKLVK